MRTHRIALAVVAFIILSIPRNELSQRQDRHPDDDLPPPVQWPAHLSNEALVQHAELQLQSVKSLREEWFWRFMIAEWSLSLNPEVACDNYRRLSRAPMFPLYNVALEKAHLACTPLEGESLTGVADLSTLANLQWLQHWRLQAGEIPKRRNFHP